MIEYIDGPCCWNRVTPSLLREQASDGASTWRNYSTARFLNGSDPRVICIEEFPELDFHSGVQVELLPKVLLRRWQRFGLQFATEEQLNDIGFREVFLRSLDLIRMADPILGTVAGLCRSVHVLVSSDMDMDTSYSDPSLPFSIFVSCPLMMEPNSVERLTENIVHEVLHLQLSLVEKSQPLADETPAQQSVFSPWKKEYRTVQGLVHSVYVFGNVRCFWKLISSRHTQYSSFAETRIEAIDNDLIDAKELVNNATLTMFGRRLVKSFLESR